MAPPYGAMESGSNNDSKSKGLIARKGVTDIFLKIYISAFLSPVFTFLLQLVSELPLEFNAFFMFWGKVRINIYHDCDMKAILIIFCNLSFP